MEKISDYNIKNDTPPPKYAFNQTAYNIVSRPQKDLFFVLIITIDMVIISTELSISNLGVISVLRICNFILVGIYMTEWIVKVCECVRSFLPNVYAKQDKIFMFVCVCLSNQ